MTEISSESGVGVLDRPPNDKIAPPDVITKIVPIGDGTRDGRDQQAVLKKSDHQDSRPPSSPDSQEKIGFAPEDLYNSALGLLFSTNKSNRESTDVRNMIGGSRRVLERTIERDGEELSVAISGSTNLQKDSKYGSVQIRVPGMGSVALQSESSDADADAKDVVRVLVRGSDTGTADYALANAQQIAELGGILEALKGPEDIRGALYEAALNLLTSSDEVGRKGLFVRRIFHGTVVGEDGNEEPVEIWGNKKLSKERHGSIEMRVPGIGRIGFQSQRSEPYGQLPEEKISVSVYDGEKHVFRPVNESELTKLAKVFDAIEQPTKQKVPAM